MVLGSIDSANSLTNKALKWFQCMKIEDMPGLFFRKGAFKDIPRLNGLLSKLDNTVRLKWIPLDVYINKLQKRADLFYHLLFWTFLQLRPKFRPDYFHPKQYLQFMPDTCLLRCTRPHHLICLRFTITVGITIENNCRTGFKNNSGLKRILSDFVICAVFWWLF